MTYRLPEKIHTPRLLLRRPSASDAEAIFQSYAQDKQVCHFLVWSAHSSVAHTEAFVASCIEAWNTPSRRPYVITEHGADAAIGMLEARMFGTTVDIGYVLARTRWGKGLMPEAVQSLTDVALNDPGVFRVQACCDVANVPSQRTLEKSGFVREGRLERYIVHPNISSEPRACFMYAKFR